MSRENVELYRRVMAALNAQDEKTLVALCDPDVEIRATFAAADGGSYHGHDGVRGWLRDVADAWASDVGLEDDVYFDLGEQTLVIGVLRGRGAYSGAEVTMEAAGIGAWRDGLLTSHRGYPSKAAALADLGLSEDALPPSEQ